MMSYFGNSFPIEEIINDRSRIAEEIIKSKGIPVKKGLYNLLDYLKQNNVKKAVATLTSRKRVLSLLKMANIDKCFDYILFLI